MRESEKTGQQMIGFLISQSDEQTTEKLVRGLQSDGLNYVIAGCAAFVPVSDAVDPLEQRRALVALKNALDMELVEIPADECAREGGALHCVIWDDPLSKTED
jgi:agmatine/peptidylarginine deiminase